MEGFISILQPLVFLETSSLLKTNVFNHLSLVCVAATTATVVRIENAPSCNELLNVYFELGRRTKVEKFLDQEVAQQMLQLVLDFDGENVVILLCGSILHVDVEPGSHEHSS